MSLFLHPIAVKKQSYIVLSFPYNCDINHHLLQLLKAGVQPPADIFATGGCEAALALFTLYKVLENKLGGSSIDALRSKFAQINVNHNGHDAILTVSEEPSFSSVRKVLSILAKNCDAAKLTPLWNRYRVALGMPPASPEWALSNLAVGLKSAQVLATGAFKVPDGKAADLESHVKAIASSQSISKVSGTKPTGWSGSHPRRFGIKGAKPWELLVAQQYLQSLSVHAFIHDHELVCTSGCKVPEDRDRVKRFIEQKITKLGERLHPVLVIIAAQGGELSAGEIRAIPKTPSESDMVKSIAGLKLL